jgi:hypothetical protein
MNSLEAELETYKKRLPDLSSNEGKFVVISGTDVLGIFESYQDALTAAYEKLGVKPFLVKRISAVETLSFFTRELACPT